MSTVFYGLETYIPISKKRRRGARTLDVGILTSTLPHFPSYSGGVFVEQIIDALEKGPDRKKRLEAGDYDDRYVWGPRDEFITLLNLRDELRHRLGQDQVALTFGCDGLRLPNRNHDPSIPETRVEQDEALSTLNLEHQSSLQEKASVASVADSARFFVERRNALLQISDWLAGPQGGMFIITGYPGAGKSTLLSRLAMLNDPQCQSALRDLDMLGRSEGAFKGPFTFDAFVNLRGMGVTSTARAIADQLGIGPLEVADPVEGLVGTLRREKLAVTLLADGLDEASSHMHARLIARDIFSEIARLPNCRLLVATRRDLSDESNFEGAASSLTAALQSHVTECRMVDLSGRVRKSFGGYQAASLMAG